MKALAAKRKKCRQCGQLFEPFSSLSIACSQKCAIKLAPTKKAKEHKKKAKKAEYRADRKRVRPLAAFHRSARDAMHPYIRLRDAMYGCISCERGQVEHAGHYFAAGNNGGLKYDERNVHGQCAACNTHRSGNQAEYTLGLIKRYGQHYVDVLQQLKRDYEAQPKKPYTREELEFIRKDYAAKRKLFETKQIWGD